MSTLDIILLAVIGAAAAAAVIVTVRNKKRGKGCGCGCEGCANGSCKNRK